MSTLDKVLKNKIIDDIQEIKEDINILNEGLEEVSEEVDSEDTPAKSQILYIKEDGDTIPEGIKLIDWNKKDGIFKVIKLSNPEATYHVHQTHIQEDNIVTYSQFLFGDGNVKKRIGIVELSNCPKSNPQPEWGEWESLMSGEEQPEEPVIPEVYSDYKSGDLVLCKEFISNPEHEVRPYTDFATMTDEEKRRIIGIVTDSSEKLFVKCRYNSEQWIYWSGTGEGQFYIAVDPGDKDGSRTSVKTDTDRDSQNLKLGEIFTNHNYKSMILEDIRGLDDTGNFKNYGPQFISSTNFVPTIYDLFNFLYVVTDYNKLPIEIFLEVSNMSEDSCYYDYVFGLGNYYYANFWSCNCFYNGGTSCSFGVQNNILQQSNNISDAEIIMDALSKQPKSTSAGVFFFQIFDKLNIK